MNQQQGITEVKSNQEWLSVKEAATYFGMAPRSLRNHIQKLRAFLDDDLKGGSKQGQPFQISSNGIIKLQAKINVNARTLNYGHVDGLQNSIIDRALEYEGVIKTKKLVITPERAKEIQQELFTLPAPKEEIVLDDDYTLLRKLIASVNNKTNLDFTQIWQTIYQDMYYSCHVNIQAQAKSRKIRPIDLIKNEGLMAKVYACAYARFKKYL